jgi:short-subunit dehydrogenase
MKKANNILITGASSGIGSALAKALAAPQKTLILVGRDLDRLQQVQTDCELKGAKTILGQADVASSAFSALVEAIDEQTPIDLVIANAGISSTTEANGRAEPIEKVRELIGTNFQGMVNTVNPLIPRMQNRQHGQIALMSSVAAYVGLPQCPTYSATKAAVLKYGESLRTWLKCFNIKVNVICPGFVKTPLNENLSGPKPMLMSPEKAARIMLTKLAKNKPIIAFPSALIMTARLAGFVPAFVRDKVLNSIHSSLSK